MIQLLKESGHDAGGERRGVEAEPGGHLVAGHRLEVLADQLLAVVLADRDLVARAQNRSCIRLRDWTLPYTHTPTSSAQP